MQKTILVVNHSFKSMQVTGKSENPTERQVHFLKLKCECFKNYKRISQVKKVCFESLIMAEDNYL